MNAHLARWLVATACLLGTGCPDESTGEQPDASDASPLDVDGGDAGDAEADVSAAPITIGGHVFIFSPAGGRLEGAEVFVLEQPERRATTDADGKYEISDVAATGTATLVLLAEGYPENQTATFPITPGEDLVDIDFQAVPQVIFEALAALTESEPDPELCQMSATVTRYFEGSLPKVHGEPGVTVTLEPDIGKGPVYFNPDVLPDLTYTETSVDGGVVYTNVPPGTYTLRAHKDGFTFEERIMTCRPDVLVNAAPPRGLQVLTPAVVQNYE